MRYLLYTIGFIYSIWITNINAEENINENLRNMIQKMEDDVLQFAEKIEEVISMDKTEKCKLFDKCSESNYDGCQSQFPLAQCPGQDYSIEQCGKGEIGGCGGLFDFSVSKTSIAPSARAPLGMEEAHVLDDICTTYQVEDYMIQSTQEDASYWESFSVMPPWLYFGSSNGVFR